MGEPIYILVLLSSCIINYFYQDKFDYLQNFKVYSGGKKISDFQSCEDYTEYSIYFGTKIFTVAKHKESQRIVVYFKLDDNKLVSPPTLIKNEKGWDFVPNFYYVEKDQTQPKKQIQKGGRYM